MPKLIPQAILAALLLATSIQAQDPPEFKMPCQQVLKLSLNKFVNLYGEKTQDYSTYGMKQAFGYYVDCRRPDNDKIALKLSETRRKQVDFVREQLSAIGSGSWSNTYITAGGGTIYGLSSVGAYAEREDFMTSLIKSLATPERSAPVSRRRARLFVNRGRRSLPSMSPPDLESWSEETRGEMLKQYQSNVKEIRSAFSQLDKLIRELPDRPAELVARHMQKEVEAGIEE